VRHERIFIKHPTARTDDSHAFAAIGGSGHDYRREYSGLWLGSSGYDGVSSMVVLVWDVSELIGGGRELLDFV
jgi:hypothetical protein